MQLDILLISNNHKIFIKCIMFTISYLGFVNIYFKKNFTILLKNNILFVIVIIYHPYKILIYMEFLLKIWLTIILGRAKKWQL